MFFFLEFYSKSDNIQLVKDEGEFKFYHLFELFVRGITNPKTWERVENYTRDDNTCSYNPNSYNGWTGEEGCPLSRKWILSR